MSRFDHTKYQPFAPIQLPDRQWPNQVIQTAPQWCSVDLRDGNQALMEPMTVAQKQQLYKLLVKLGFKQIEVGFPSASQPDFDFVRWLIEENQIPDDVTIQVLTQAREHLIERTFESLKGAKQAIVHVYNSTSTVQREQVFGLDRQGIKDIAVNGAQLVKQYAAQYPETDWTFQYSPESFTGTELDFAVEVVDAVLEVWQPSIDNKAIINLPATVEMATPNVFADQVEWFARHVTYRQAIELSVHTHNDRGCGVAAAELAVMAGADRVEGTLMGNGERTGNMDIVTMAMNLYSQGIDPKLDLSEMDDIVATVKACTQLPVHPRHPYAGELVFTAFSGSHQDAIKKCLDHRKKASHESREENAPWQVAYLPIDPKDLGRSYQEVIRVNSQSGKGGVAYTMSAEYGIEMPRWMQIEFSQHVQKMAEAQGGEVSSQHMLDLFKQTYIDRPAVYRLGAYNIERTTSDQIHAQLQPIDESITNDGVMNIAGQGTGVVEAFVNALSEGFNLDIKIHQYHEHALDHGSDAEAIAYVQTKVDGQNYVAAAVHQDTVSALLNAVLATCNQVLAERDYVSETTMRTA
jgi:2-isopropylmalate synthase